MTAGSNVVNFPGVDVSAELNVAVALADEALRSNHPEAVALALKIFDTALQLCPENQELLVRRAITLSVLGRGDDAIEAHDLALRKCDSTESEGRLRAGRSELLLQVGRLPEALADSKTAVALCPDVAGILLGHARALAFNGQRDEAIDAYDDLIERHKTLDLAHEVIGIDPIIAERDAIVRLFLESDVA